MQVQEEDPVCRSVPGCRRTNGAHSPEKRASRVLLLMLSEPGGTRTRREAQSTDLNAETSHSRQVPAYKTKHVQAPCPLKAII